MDLWYNSDQALSVALSQVENLVEMSHIIQDLHTCTPPPSLSLSSSAIELDARALTLPPVMPLVFVNLGDFPWLLWHPIPLSTVFLPQWCNSALLNGVPASVLECLIRTKTAPMTAAEKRQVPRRLKVQEWAMAAFTPE